MSIICFIQSVDGKIPTGNLSVISAGLLAKKSFNVDKIFGVVFGDHILAESVSEYGLDEVFNLNHTSPYFFCDYCTLINQVISDQNGSIFITSATSIGKDLSPHVAVQLNAGQASDIIGIEDNGVLIRPMYAGDIIAKVTINTDKKVITVRNSAFSPPQKVLSKSKVSEFKFTLSNDKNLGAVLSVDEVKGDRPELGDAKVVVSGGRALQSAENFEKYIFPLADAFGAAIGASRAAVDSGYAPNDWQVGQTGKIVAPDLYIAVGISGAIQHLAGMKDSKTIVAINKDAEAPIYEIADYGLVADLFQVVPEITNKVKLAKS